MASERATAAQPSIYGMACAAASAAVEMDRPLPKVTPSLLRDADQRCPRRLVREYESDHQQSSSPVNRARLRDAFLRAARRMHMDLRAPAVDDFDVPDDLEPEERAALAHAARWYAALYDRPVRTFLHELDSPTPHRGRGIRVGGWVDLTVEDADGRKELRQLDLWGRALQGDDPLAYEAVRLGVLRLSRWVGDEPLRVSWADLVGGRLVERVIDVRAELPELTSWLDERVAVVEARADDTTALPGRDCGTCSFVAGCPAHPGGAHQGTRRGDLRPGIITITPTSLDRWHRCRREWRSKTLLSVPESDPSAGGDRGRLVHDLLRFVHEHGSCADDEHVERALSDHGLADDFSIRECLARHARRCPAPARALGHERELARFHRLPLPLFMATARFDALWEHDGVLDARDYKTGAGRIDRVADDPKARVQAWVLAPMARECGLRLRLRYEQLAAEVDEDPEPFEPDDDELDSIEEELRSAVEDMRAEEAFTGVAEPDDCRHCAYRSICPDSAAVPAAPGWPEP